MSILAEKSLDRPVMNKYETLFHRHPSNPILTGKDWPYSMNSVFNAGATLLPDGSTLLLCRVEDRRGLSHLCVARSANGVDGWQIDREPTFIPDVERFPEELWGVEDPRITYMPELQQYAVAYTSYSRGGPGVSLALTKDFRVFEKLGVVMSPDDKDAALLPRRINGSWALIHRPMTPLGAHIWISYSPDLRHWGNHKLMLEARRGAWWDANKIGMSPPPIETSRGWLMIYHGVRRTPSSSIYRLGLALFDLEQPEKCLIRGDSWMFAPEAEYERHGYHQSLLWCRRFEHCVGARQYSQSSGLAGRERPFGTSSRSKAAAKLGSVLDATSSSFTGGGQGFLDHHITICANVGLLEG